MEAFKHLGLSEQVLKVIEELGFEKPSEIQERAIPQLISEDRDCIGLAQTGTGKTAAFSIPLLERIDPQNRATQALVLAPTRELGQQIAEQVNIFGRYLDRINVLAVYGGTNIVNQIRALRNPQHIVIATPGRLIDLIKRKAVKLDELECLVLDEADEMLNMGFKQDIDEILSHAPDETRVWLFSATMSKDIRGIVNTYMTDPIEVKVDSKNKVNTNIEHQFVQVRQPNKMEALIRFLDVNPDMRGVVFCRTKRDTQDVSDRLFKKGYKADALHGDLSQRQRDRVMQRFKKHDLQVLIATDVAARGIDVNDLTHVFHFNIPDDLAYYTHRSGRTGRAGKKGTSIVFVNGREKGRLNYLSKQLNISFEKKMVPSADDVFDNRVDKWCQEILEKKTNGRMNPMLLEKATLLFGNLSKEELIAKILMQEIENINLDSVKDLNDTSSSRGGGDRRPRRRGYGGGRSGSRGRSRNDRDRNRSGKRRRRY